MAKDFAKWLYADKAWRSLATNLKMEKGKCERCHKLFTGEDITRELIGHHKIKLTEENITNPDITLNTNNIEIICKSCHNKEHSLDRAKVEKKVYIVYGSPLSGKTEYVKENMLENDIILDIDNIWEAITNKPRYIKPDKLKYNAFDIYSYIQEKIKIRYGDWETAYIIAGLPNKIDRDRLAEQLGAELIYISSTRAECIKRCNTRPKEWIYYINMWWDEFEKESYIPPSIIVLIPP